jgi:hypothetical protein
MGVMEKENNSTALTLALLLGIFLQVFLAYADTVDTPGKAVVKFSQAYFKLDPSMSRYLCNELASAEETDAVSRFINRASVEAGERGFEIGYLKSYLYEITTHTLSRSEERAQVRIHCKRRKSINPVFAIVAKLFFIGNTYTVDEVIDMVKENGKWKVCGKPFSLTAV